MNIRDKIIQDNFKRCEAMQNRLTVPEIHTIGRLKRDGVSSQPDFNTLSRIADTSERRKLAINAQLEVSGHWKCPQCGVEVMWIKTLRGKSILINAATCDGTDIFNKNKHKCHWDDCDYKLPTTKSMKVNNG